MRIDTGLMPIRFISARIRCAHSANKGSRSFVVSPYSFSEIMRSYTDKGRSPSAVSQSDTRRISASSSLCRASRNSRKSSCSFARFQRIQASFRMSENSFCCPAVTFFSRRRRRNSCTISGRSHSSNWSRSAYSRSTAAPNASSARCRNACSSSSVNTVLCAVCAMRGLTVCRSKLMIR